MKILYRKKIFYGWYIVGALFIANFLMQGGVRNGYGIFVETWEKEFVATTASISLAASIGWLINGLSQPILGRLADAINEGRHGSNEQRGPDGGRK